MGLKPIDVIFDSGQVDMGNATGSTDNPKFTLLPAVEKCVGISLIYANIPFTYYVVDETNNQFKFNGALCTIQPGTYNSINIVPQLNLAATNAGALNTSFFVDSTTSKLVASLTVVGTFTLDFTVGNTVASVLGFDNIIYSSSSTPTIYDNSDVALTNDYIQAPRVVNLSGPSQMFLNSDLGSVIYGNVRNQSGARSLLGFWPVNANYQGTIDMIRENPPVIKTSPVNISSLNLNLTIGNRISYGALNNAYLSLNGEAFQVGIRFWVETDINEFTTDGAGNSVMSSTNLERSSIFKNASNLNRTSVFGS
jgi:hypothetical protein